MKKRRIATNARRFSSLLLVGLIIFQVVAIAGAPKKVRASEDPTGPVKSVIVQFRGSAVVKSADAPTKEQAAEIAQRQSWLSQALDYAEGYKKQTRTYSQLPFAVYDVDAEGEASLRANPNVVAVTENKLSKPLALSFQTTPGVSGGDWEDGFTDGTDNFTGEGYAVAVLDQGVDKTHPSLTGTVISEACYSEAGDYTNVTITSPCPGGAESSTATDSGLPCGEDCDHGTMVASMIAMQPTTGLSVGADPVEASGIAKNAKIISIQVFSEITEKVGQPNYCGDIGNSTETCYLTLSSSQLAGFNRVLELHNASTLDETIVAANLSAGGGPYTSDESTCGDGDADTLAVNTVAQSLKAANIATVIAAGNDGGTPGNEDKIASPGCLSNVVAVSASTADDHMTTYTNAGPLTDLVAPGGEASGSAPHEDGGLLLATPGDDVESQYITNGQGTSFAAPIVAATWALVREKAPTASVDGVLEGLQDTGESITEDREDYTATVHKRVNIGAALQAADTFDTQAPVQPPSENPPSETPGGSNPSDGGWIPGVPSAGNLSIIRSVAIIAAAAVALVIMNKNAALRLAGRRA